MSQDNTSSESKSGSQCGNEIKMKFMIDSNNYNQCEKVDECMGNKHGKDKGKCYQCCLIMRGKEMELKEPTVEVKEDEQPT